MPLTQFTVGFAPLPNSGVRVAPAPDNVLILAPKGADVNLGEGETGMGDRQRGTGGFFFRANPIPEGRRAKSEGRNAGPGPG